MTFSQKGKKVIRRILRIVAMTIGILLCLILLILLLIRTGPVQNYGRGKIEAYLENKLHTKVRIGNLYIDFPSRIILKNIYLEDRRKDTLVSGGRIEVAISMLRLLHKEIRVDNFELENITLKVKRLQPDTVFNFQFIADAFSSGLEKEPVQKDTSAGFKFIIGTIHLHQIHALYSDDASGNEVYVNLGDFKTKIKTFDPAHQSYSIPDISLSDISGNVRQYKPILILQHAADTISEHNKKSEPVKLELGDIDFTRISLDYRNEAQNMNAAIRLGNFHTKADSIDLATLHIKLKQISLANTDAELRFGNLPAARKPVKPAAPKDTIAHAGAWNFDIARFTIDNTRVKYDDDNKAPTKKGIDYNHLDIKKLQVHASGLHADPANYQAVIEGISMEEKSGLVLKKLSAGIRYGNSGASLKNLVVQTNYSLINNQTTFQYRNQDEMKKHPGDIGLNLEFDRSRIAVRDVLIFVPSLEGPLKDNQNAVLQLNGKITGRLKDIQIPFLEISGVGNTSLAASGYIKGLPDGKKAYYDITIARLNTSRTDIFRFVPARSMPDNLRIPEHIALNGKFTGTIKRFRVQLHTVTSGGNAEVSGTLDLDHKTYDLVAGTRALDIGYLLKQDSLLGKITLNAKAKGSGFDLKKMNGDFHVSLADAEFKSYHYKGLIMDAHMKDGTATLQSSMNDPNLTYQLNAEAGFQEKYPSVKMKLKLDTINALALHLMNDSLQMHVLLDADFKSTNPDALEGQLALTNMGISLGTLPIHTDSVLLLAQHSDTGESIRLNSEAADIEWTGRYKLTQVSESIRHFVNTYYKIPVSMPDTTEPEEWQMKMILRPSPLVLTLMPSLRGSDSLTGNISFNSRNKDLQLDLHTDKIQFNQQVIHKLQVMASSKENELDYKISVADAGQPGFRLYQSAVYGAVKDNKLFTTLLLKDKKAKNKYLLSGTLSQKNNGLHFVFNSDSTLLNYSAWQIPGNNFIQYDSSGILVRNLSFTRQTESLVLNSAGETTSAPLDISFANFKIKTLTQFAEQDSLLEGTINGKAEVKDLFTSPLFTSDLKIDSLMYEKDTLGTLVLKVNNESANEFTAHIHLSGHDNDVQVDGKYFAGESKMDMNVKLNQLNLASFKGIAATQVRRMTGYLKGELHASGNIDQPQLKGTLHFDNAVIVPIITGEPLKLSNDRIDFDEEGFDFENFVMQDSAGNKATLDGNVFTKDFKHYKFDLSFSAQNFRVVNAPKEPNRMFYGKLNLNADIDLTGDDQLPKMNAYIKVNKNTDFFVILPSDDPEVVERQGVVVFTSKTQKVDSARFKSFLDSLAATARLKGMDVSATIETDSSGQFTLIIDERNGDALTIRGRAELTGGVDKSGKMSLTGNYELVNGAYTLTLSVLHRKFDIQRGSTITWTGDPKKAEIDITAIYTVNTPPIDLVEQQISQNTSDQTRYKQRLPFQVKLKMTGELLKPTIKFDIALPDNLLALWPEVDLKLVQMRTDEAEINKQVFALLLLGRFVQENPFASSGAPVNAESIARQSASKILSDQLNQLAGSLIKGVDITFDMNSGQDYSTGTTTNQTDLNVKVSKNLFNDRIRVSVGSDFQLEETNPGENTTNLAGDVSVDYRLSKDGRYMLRVYRKDQYETVVQAQVVETGVSFILTFDYNKFRELFENRKDPSVAPTPKKHKKSVSETNTPPK